MEITEWLKKQLLWVGFQDTKRFVLERVEILKMPVDKYQSSGDVTIFLLSDCKRSGGYNRYRSRCLHLLSR